MVEKIRVSLWDIFTFFLTGFFVATLAIAFFVAYSPITWQRFGVAVIAIPTTLTIVGSPLAFTLIGMLIEPFANYTDKYIFRWILGWAGSQKDKHSEEEQILKNEILEKYLGSLNGKLSNPYSICKEYVETKGLSTTFMVFLSRYGFYRNCAFLCFSAAAVHALLEPAWISRVVAAGIWFFSSAVFKRRAQDFYRFQAPSVYRAFLIDKLDWHGKSNA